MTYELKTVDGKYTRALNGDDFKTILRIALKNGWQPSSRHLRDGQLRMSIPMNVDEAKALAAAIDRGIKTEGATLLPPVIVAFLECIGVLRRGKARFVLRK
jgi:hypothetical protein